MQGTKGAFSGRGAQSALLAFGGRIRVIRAYGGHETEPAVYRRLFTRTGYALDRLSRNPKAPAAADKDLHPANAFRQSPLSGQDALDCNPRRPWEPPCVSNAA